jgi:4'-phosphopantetheinyl transferase
MEIVWPRPTEAVALSADTLDVWAARLEGVSARWNELRAILSDAERQRAEQFRLDEPRRRFEITRAALRMLLGRYLGTPVSGVELAIDHRGKPRLAGDRGADDIHFNLAHSGSIALIAVTAGCDVGVDVERIRAAGHVEQIARRYFHPAESQAILSAVPSARDAVFLRCWTGKEAVLKAIGSGVTGSLASFRVPTDEFQAARIALPGPLSTGCSHCWLYALAPCNGYVGAVACLGEERIVRPFAFDM